MREISRTPIYRVCCYEVICLRNRANPVGSRAFQQTDTNNLKIHKVLKLEIFFNFQFSHYDVLDENIV